MRNRAAIGGIAFAIGAYGFAFGVLARASGLGWLAVLVMSAFAYSGGAQAAFVAALVTGTPSSALLSGVLVNLRLGIYGAIAGRLLSKDSRWARAGAVHFASDETIALSAGAEPGDAAVTFWTSGITFFAVWVSSTVVGAVVGGGIGNPETLGLDVAFAAVFVALLLPMLDTPAVRIAALVAAIATMATIGLPPGLPILVAASTAVAVVYLHGKTTEIV